MYILRFCEGAAWRAVQDKLSEASIKPIAADRCCLESKITACAQLTEAVQQSQQALRAEIQRELQAEEQQLYVRVLVQKELEAKATHRFSNDKCMTLSTACTPQCGCHS